MSISLVNNLLLLYRVEKPGSSRARKLNTADPRMLASAAAQTLSAG